jgi:hypothetical protein
MVQPASPSERRFSMCGETRRPGPADDAPEKAEVREQEPIPSTGGEGLPAADDRDEQWWVERLTKRPGRCA